MNTIIYFVFLFVFNILFNSQVICFVRDENHIPLAKEIWIESGGGFDHPIVFVVASQLPRGALVEWQICAHQKQCSIEQRNSDSIPGSNIVMVRNDGAIAVTCSLGKCLFQLFFSLTKSSGSFTQITY